MSCEGLVYDDGLPPRACFEVRVDWVEGVAILAAVCIVVIVGSVNDWQKEAQFKVLNAKKEDRSVTVIRDGQECMINVKVTSRRYAFRRFKRLDLPLPVPGCGRRRYLPPGTWRDYTCRWYIPPWAQRAM